MTDTVLTSVKNHFSRGDQEFHGESSEACHFI